MPYVKKIVFCLRVCVCIALSITLYNMASINPCLCNKHNKRMIISGTDTEKNHYITQFNTKITDMERELRIHDYTRSANYLHNFTHEQKRLIVYIDHHTFYECGWNIAEFSKIVKAVAVYSSKYYSYTELNNVWQDIAEDYAVPRRTNLQYPVWLDMVSDIHVCPENDY